MGNSQFCKKISVKGLKFLIMGMALLFAMTITNGCVLKTILQQRKIYKEEKIKKETEAKAEVSRDKCVSVASSFYNEYIMALNDNEDNNEEKIKNIKSKYMTENLIIEMDYRSKKKNGDAIVAYQDATGLLKLMGLIMGRKIDTAIVSFENKNKDGSVLVNEMELHFRKVGEKVLIDGIDFTVIKKNINGKESSKKEETTKYAIKKELTEKDNKELEKMKKYCEENK